MKIIITAGGTTEKIDAVRKIANSATGKLGSLTAEECIRQGGGRIEKIFYVCEKGTIVPSHACVEVIETQGVSAVKDVLVSLLTSNKIDAVIHSMAVSDYTVGGMTTADDLAGFIANRFVAADRLECKSESELSAFIAQCIKENNRLLDSSKKVGSHIENLMLSMKQTPKLIGLIKAIQPSAVLVGFKLINGVSRQYLLEAGYRILEKNSCDFVLANDLCEIDGNQHMGLLISPDRSYELFSTKAEIAQGIVRKVLRMIDRKV